MCVNADFTEERFGRSSIQFTESQRKCSTS